MKHQKLLSGLILTGLLLLVCLTGSAAAANVSVSPGLVHYSENFTLFVDYDAGTNYQWYYSTDDGTTWTPISGAIQPGMSFIPAEQDWVEPYSTTYKFKVTFTDEGATRTAIRTAIRTT